MTPNLTQSDDNLGSVTGVSSGQSQFFAYDGANRLVQESLGSGSLSCGQTGTLC